MTRAHIPQLADKYMNHEMIARHTELPDFPAGRTQLLQTLLGVQPTTAASKELFALATSLVQMGIDTHEQVDNSDQSAKQSMSEMRSRQLKVLAGDYFSSRFYQLLSQTGQFERVSALSEAICDINVIKMNLYSKVRQFKLSAEEYLNAHVQVKSKLFLSFAGLMSGIYQRIWPDLIQRFSRCELLLEELEQARQSKLDGCWGMWHILHEGSDEDRRKLHESLTDTGVVQALLHKYQITDKLKGLLGIASDQLQHAVQLLQSDKLTRELQPLIEPFVQAVKPSCAVALKAPG